MLTRLEGWLFDGAGEGEPGAAKLRAFRSFVLLHGAARSWRWLYFFDQSDPVSPLLALLLTACFALSLHPRFGALAPRIALPALLLQLYGSLPTSDNHFGIELLCVAVLCVVDRNDAEGEQLALRGLMAITVVVLFHTGLQKVMHGQYFGGEFLAYMVGQDKRFADFFQWLLPAAEVARLQALDPLQDGAGPYRVASLPFIAASNAVYLAELGLPFLLALRRTRTLGALLAIGFVLTLQLSAREFGFALLFSGMLLLFLPWAVGRWLLPLQAAVYLWAVGATAGWLPGAGLMASGNL